MKKANVVLVGIGGYGNTFVKDILENPSEAINLVGVVDPYPERCENYNALKEKNIPMYSDMVDFYREHEADLAVISTPIFLHTQNIITALEHGSNALCEKPLCADEADIEKMRDAQKKSGKFIYIGYQWAYSDAITALKKDITDGKFGKLIEMKTLILRPRDRDYFGRGVGWAGKIRAANGMLVYDSVANNSAAHYLFNMMYLMGDYGRAAEASNVTAELLRANEIENFDTSKIQFEMVSGAKACFIAAHPVNKAIEPIFEYRFEKGTVYYSSMETDASYQLMPAEYKETKMIKAIMNDGSEKIYGDPMANQCKKMHMAVKAALDGDCSDGPCGLEAAAVHTRLINEIQKKFPVYDFKQSLLREEKGLVYAHGLFEGAVKCYKNLDKSLLSFADIK